LNFDLARALRQLKPEKVQVAPTRRQEADLPFHGEPGPGRDLLLDTTIYIDVLQGRTQRATDDLLRLRLTHHSSVVLSELTHLFGRLDPADRRTPQALRETARMIGDIPRHRLTTPSVQASGKAGILSGLVARLSGVPAARHQATLNDALIYAHAVERGLVVLTRNIRDFDLFDQLWPADSVLFYRTG
jgi:predicted nucleic acid-binding protein